MLTVYSGGFPLHDPGKMASYISEAKFSIRVGEAGSATLTVTPDYPYMDFLRPLVTEISLKEDGDLLFRGRVLRTEKDFMGFLRVEVEGILAALNDTVIPPFDYPGGVPGAATAPNQVSHFLGWLLAQHNAQSDTKILLGKITVSDPNNYIGRSSEKYLTTMEVLKTRILNTFSGYLVIRYGAGGTYLDYLSELEEYNEQLVEYGENLVDLSVEMDGTEAYSAILPVGADGLTVQSVPNQSYSSDIKKSGLLVYSESGRLQHGKVTRIMEWDDVTIAQNLYKKAAKKLEAVAGLTREHLTVKAVDLGFTDEEVRSFRVGKLTNVVSRPHGIHAPCPLTAMDVDPLSPGETEITVERTSTFSYAPPPPIEV